MSNPIDDIFSPERLRARWQVGIDQVDARKSADPMPSDSESAMGVFNRLQTLIHERFPGEQGNALNVIMEELKDLLDQRFPPEAEMSDEEKALLNRSIQETLNMVEDLIDALQL